MEVECALLEGEQESEMAQLQRDKECLEELKGKIHNIEKTGHTEKSQVKLCKDDKKEKKREAVNCSLGLVFFIADSEKSEMSWHLF